MATDTATESDTLTFFFDPGCPWTWITSRWFVDATSRSGHAVKWRAFSLTLINAGSEIPEEYQAGMKLSHRALRVIESLTAEGRDQAAGDFYTEFGTRTFIKGEAPSDDVLVAAGEATGVPDALERANDEANEALVQAGFDEILPPVGEDVGSPSIKLESTGNAIFGPIVNPAPKGAGADSVLTATIALLEVPEFFELKRSRTTGPDFS
ncbi:DsbA family protein [soil metagenome]